MKKFTLMALAIMASAASFAQTTLWDGEDATVTSKDNAGFWPDGSPVLTDNPEKDGINTSEHCLKFTMTNDNKVVKLPFREWIQPSLNGSKRISMMIKKSQDENMMIELSDPTNGSDGYWHKVATWYGGDNKWQKVVFDFSDNDEFDYPGIMTITAQTANVEGEQIVYIDNIVIEGAPKVGDALLSGLADNSVTDNVKLAGAWMKGTCMNADTDNDWKEVNYNDFETFNAKASDKLTSVDMRGTVTKDVDANQFFFKNPNALLYADEAYDRANVIAPDAKKENALWAVKGVELTDGYDFNAPEAFTATHVKMTRTMRKGVNSFVLPFWTSAADLGASRIATYASEADNKVNFTTVDHADGNVPFIAEFDNMPEGNELTFSGSNKYFDVTPDEFAGKFRGVYKHQSAKGLYGINLDGNFQKGGEDATIGAFHAYYTPEEGQEAPAAITIDGEATGINAVNATAAAADGAVYDLSGRRVAASLAAAKLVKGVYVVYVVNGKKFIVK